MPRDTCKKNILLFMYHIACVDLSCGIDNILSGPLSISNRLLCSRKSRSIRTVTMIAPKTVQFIQYTPVSVSDKIDRYCQHQKYQKAAREKIQKKEG